MERTILRLAAHLACVLIAVPCSGPLRAESYGAKFARCVVDEEKKPGYIKDAAWALCEKVAQTERDAEIAESERKRPKAPSKPGDSAFVFSEFDGDVRIALPRNWKYMDERMADDLNTSSEAAQRLAGHPSSQGDNKVLLAANAYDDHGISRATVRLSMREGPGPSQSELKTLSKQSSEEIEAGLLPVAMETVQMMLKRPGVRSYRVRGVRIDSNPSLWCTLFSFEGEYHGKSIVSDTWHCPLGNRALKLSTSYDQDRESVYRPIVDYMRQSLTVQTGER